MNTPSYIALSSQMALQRQMDVLSNNVANASTPAFRGERLMFAEYLVRGPAGMPTGNASMVQDFGMMRDTREGPLTRTGNSFDLALKGDGYFVVDTPTGPRETRNGRFQLDAQGRLVTSEGYTVHGEGDQPITLPDGAADVTIGRDGTITTAEGEAGRLQVVRFERDSDLVPAANGLYATEVQPLPAPDVAVLQGMVEDSNVQPVVEMTRLMQVARSFAFAKQMADGEDDRLKNAIDKLSRVA
jgi:flagellar basal-body rod protein FlgF